ncbi:probable G-protein coupled receptor 139 [Scyliorhinus torazame]|uniref:probable G-protein coupled receptor 139 n=1 Tax=Scyliorhinus torazame TaxID=75743 RepID=UPI003B59DF9B
MTVISVCSFRVNVVAMVILSRGKCGLCKCVTYYLIGMAGVDLSVVIFDLILRHIPIVFREQFEFVLHIPMCNIHSALLYAATDCSVWLTVTFTFDRYVAIGCKRLKQKYCPEKTAAVVLGTVTFLSCSIDIYWYFILAGPYWRGNQPWFCHVPIKDMLSVVWGTIEFLHYILTPGVPFVLIMLLNVFTLRHFLVSNRDRKRLRAHSCGESTRDPEVANRRKPMILLFVISANLIILWSVIMLFSIRTRMYYQGYEAMYLHWFVQEMGFMLQLLSCCTNTCIYAVTQTKFRDELKNVFECRFLR